MWEPCSQSPWSSTTEAWYRAWAQVIHKGAGLWEAVSLGACLGGSAFHDPLLLLRIVGNGSSLQLQIRAAFSGSALDRGPDDRLWQASFSGALFAQ